MRPLTLLVLVCLTAVAHFVIALAGQSLNVGSTSQLGVVADIVQLHPNVARLLLQQALAMVVPYLLFFLLVVVLAAPGPIRNRPLRLVVCWAALSWLLLRVHSSCFPNSVWRWALEPVFQPRASLLVDALAAAYLLNQVGCGLRNSFRALRAHARFAGVSLSLLVISWLAYWPIHSPPPSPAHSSAGFGQPNVILIGLDSLRRDIALGDDRYPMPHLAAFREHSYVQTNVVTPLARTYPAWTTVLTGLSPELSGAQENLASQKLVDTGASLAWNFKAQGYKTVYATDETRFSNIGAAYGFDQVISPLPGVTDFLLGQLSDMPLVNMAIQIPGAERWLPSLVGNRALAHSYRPERFISRLDSELGAATGQPTLLAVHLCLAHWPFTYAEPTKHETEPYFAMLGALDQQFGDLLALLERQGYANERSMVVVFTDHGESLPSRARHFDTVASQTSVPLPVRSSGHGSSLLDSAGWEVFTLFRGHSFAGVIPHGQSSQLASLADIRATVLALSGVESADGYRMEVARESGAIPRTTEPRRSYVRMETGFRPAGFDMEHPNKKQAAEIAMNAFNVLPDGRVEMNETAYQSALADKDYGVTDGRHVLSLVQNPAGKLLVSDDLLLQKRSIYPIRRIKTSEPIPLLPDACREDVFTRQLIGWCDHLAVP